MADTIPGGRYLVNGQWVDADGRRVAAPKAEKPRKEAEKSGEQSGENDRATGDQNPPA